MILRSSDMGEQRRDEAIKKLVTTETHEGMLSYTATEDRLRWNCSPTACFDKQGRISERSDTGR